MDRTQYTTVLEVVTQVPDYRKRKGRYHRWLTRLSLIAAALASAQHTPQAIARWVREHRADRFAALPPTVSRLPSGSTIRRTLARLDVTALETAWAAFQPPATPVPRPLRPPRPSLRHPHPHRYRGWRSMAKRSVVLDAMGIPAIWSVWCSMATPACSAKAKSPTSGMNAVRFRSC